MAAGNEDELLRMSMSGLPSASAEAAFNAEKVLGNTAFREGRYQDALSHYTLAEEINPCSPLAPANRAMAHLKMRNFAAANADVTIALALQDEMPRQPNHNALRVKLLLRRGAARVGLGQLPRAARDYADVLEIEPEHRDAKAALNGLRNEHGVTPPPRRAQGAPPRIDVVMDAPTTAPSPSPSVSKEQSHRSNGAGTNSTSNDLASHSATDAATGRLVRDFPLMRISESAVKNLTAKWTQKPPRDALEFERAWKSLRGSTSGRERAEYLLLVGERRIRAGLLGHSLTEQQLHGFITALLCGDATDQRFRDGSAGVLAALTRVPRFNIAVMLMPNEHKRDISAFIDRLENNGIPQSLANSFRTAFELA